METRSIPVLSIGCEGIGPGIWEVLCPLDSTHGMFPHSFTRKGKDPGPETVWYFGIIQDGEVQELNNPK